MPNLSHNVQAAKKESRNKEEESNLDVGIKKKERILYKVL